MAYVAIPTPTLGQPVHFGVGLGTPPYLWVGKHRNNMF